MPHTKPPHRLQLLGEHPRKDCEVLNKELDQNRRCRGGGEKSVYNGGNEYETVAMREVRDTLGSPVGDALL